MREIGLQTPGRACRSPCKACSVNSCNRLWQLHKDCQLHHTSGIQMTPEVLHKVCFASEYTWAVAADVCCRLLWVYNFPVCPPLRETHGLPQPSTWGHGDTQQGHTTAGTLRPNNQKLSHKQPHETITQMLLSCNVIKKTIQSSCYELRLGDTKQTPVSIW